MSSNDEKKTRKLVGILIEVLHGDYSDTRDLAVVQLALLGQEAVPYICSFLEKEGELEKDLIEYHKIEAKGVITEDELEKTKLNEAKIKFADNFEKKWGFPPEESGDYEQRRDAVEGAFRALSIIGDPKAIPILKKLPIYDYVIRDEIEARTLGRVPLFQKVKETIDRIQSGG